MNMNRFLMPFADGFGELPGRFYARLDQSTETSVLMDPAGADCFDENMGGEPGFALWRDRSNDAETFVVEIFSLLIAGNNRFYFGGSTPDFLSNLTGPVAIMVRRKSSYETADTLRFDQEVAEHKQVPEQLDIWPKTVAKMSVGLF